MLRWYHKENYTGQSWAVKEDFIQDNCNRLAEPELKSEFNSSEIRVGLILRDRGGGNHRPSMFANWPSSKEMVNTHIFIIRGSVAAWGKVPT